MSVLTVYMFKILHKWLIIDIVLHSVESVLGFLQCFRNTSYQRLFYRCEILRSPFIFFKIIEKLANNSQHLFYSYEILISTYLLVQSPPLFVLDNDLLIKISGSRSGWAGWAIAYPKFIDSFEFRIKHFLDFNTCTKDQHECVYIIEILRFDWHRIAEC